MSVPPYPCPRLASALACLYHILTPSLSSPVSSPHPCLRVIHTIASLLPSPHLCPRPTSALAPPRPSRHLSPRPTSVLARDGAAGSCGSAEQGSGTLDSPYLGLTLPLGGRGREGDGRARARARRRRAGAGAKATGGRGREGDGRARARRRRAGAGAKATGGSGREGDGRARARRRRAGAGAKATGGRGREGDGLATLHTLHTPRTPALRPIIARRDINGEMEGGEQVSGGARKGCDPRSLARLVEEVDFREVEGPSSRGRGSGNRSEGGSTEVWSGDVEVMGAGGVGGETEGDGGLPKVRAKGRGVVVKRGRSKGVAGVWGLEQWRDVGPRRRSRRTR
ncbi:unnamed protein product [Closterium sp. NIES-64]|nr:unnamed protein product [Closterium sp. NIES-64]